MQPKFQISNGVPHGRAGAVQENLWCSILVNSGLKGALYMTPSPYVLRRNHIERVDSSPLSSDAEVRGGPLPCFKGGSPFEGECFFA